MLHASPFGPFIGPHLDFSWLWPLMIVFFSLAGWRRFAGGPHHGHRRHELPSPESGDSALESLRQRFARGEIDRAEYEERRAALRGRPSTSGTARPTDRENAKNAESLPEWPDLT